MANGDQEAQEGFGSFARLGDEEEDEDLLRQESPQGFGQFATLPEGTAEPEPEPPRPAVGGLPGADTLTDVTSPPSSPVDLPQGPPAPEPEEPDDRNFLERGVGLLVDPLKELVGSFQETDTPEQFQQRAQVAGEIASAIGEFAKEHVVDRPREEAQERGRELAEAEERGEEVATGFQRLLAPFTEQGPTQEAQEEESRRRVRDSLKGALRGVLPFATEIGAGTLRLTSAVTPDETLLEAAGAPEPEALDQAADFLLDQEEQALEVLGETETDYGMAAEIGTRLGLELATFVGAGQGVRTLAGKASRSLVEGGRISSRLAQGAEKVPGLRAGSPARGLGRIESPTSFTAAVTEDILSGGVVDYLIASSAEKNASATFLRDLSEKPEIRAGLIARGVDEPEKVTEFLDTVVDDHRLRGLFEGAVGSVLAVPVIGVMNRAQQRAARRVADFGDIRPGREVPDELGDAEIGPREASELGPEQRLLPRKAESIREQELRRIEQRRDARGRRERAALAQLSRGEVEFDDLPESTQRELGAGRGNRERFRQNLERLPGELYHVTTAARAVREEGLKSRYQLDADRGRG
ncbi:MAG: hypothetical protein ACOC83_07140, partial [Gemmatimonadota bacterium]